MESEMDALKIQILPENRSLSTLSKPKTKPTKSILFLIVASVALTVGLLCVFPANSVLCTGTLLGKTFRHYSVVIDAGSSGTRVHVFEYWFKAGKPVFDFGEEHYANLKLSPGLSSYADYPDRASNSVTKLVEFAKGRIPKGKWKKSDVRLMATAGMRLLTPTVQEQILEVTRIVLRSSGLFFRDEWATVITGSDEGVYAWIAANFALGSLGSDPLETTGIVELGGASAQVTFVANETVPPEYSRKILYGNVSYTIYSHSFLNYGKDAARRMLLESLENSVANSTEYVTVADPCTPKGYIYDKTSQEEVSGFLTDESKFKGSLEAAGNFSKCRSATYALLQQGTENCPYKHCSIGPTFTPDLRGSFLATSNFFYTSEFFGLEEKGWLFELITAGKKYCADEWSKIKMEYPNEKEEYLRSYCFASAYIISMLHDSFGIALDDERITYASNAGAKNMPLDWALGALILDAVTQISGYSATSRNFLAFE